MPSFHYLKKKEQFFALGDAEMPLGIQHFPSYFSREKHPYSARSFSLYLKMGPYSVSIHVSFEQHYLANIMDIVIWRYMFYSRSWIIIFSFSYLSKCDLLQSVMRFSSIKYRSLPNTDNLTYGQGM